MQVAVMEQVVLPYRLPWLQMLQRGHVQEQAPIGGGDGGGVGGGGEEGGGDGAEVVRVKGGRGSLFPGVILYYGMSIQFHGSSYGGAAEPRVDVVTGWHACRCIRAHGMGLVEAAPATAKP